MAEDVPRFTKGDQVWLKLQRDQIGYVTGDPRRIAGEFWYSVQFANGATKKAPENNLELFEGAPDVWTPLEARLVLQQAGFLPTHYIQENTRTVPTENLIRSVFGVIV